MNWNELNSIDQLETINSLSYQQPVVIFKHSTRCSISSTALDRLNRSWATSVPDHVSAWYLDLLANREISNAIASRYGVEHQSPQVLIIVDGKCAYSASHFNINASDIGKHVPQT